MLQLYSFDSGYSLLILGKDCLSVCVGGREDQILQNKKSPNIAFQFFTTIKLIYTLVYQSLNSYFFCFLKYESFSNCQQSYYRNIGYFEGIYTCMCEFDFSPANWKGCKICKWDDVFTQCINSLKIAIIIYKKFSWYDVDQRNWALYATVARQAKTKKIKMIYFHVL